MRHIETFLITLLFSLATCWAQESAYYTHAVSLLQQGKADSLKVHIEAWEHTEPNNAEIYALWLNYYYTTASKEIVNFQEEEPLEASLAIVDSTGNTVGYMVSSVVYDKETLQKGYDKIDEGIALYPNRLDFYFGKIRVIITCSKNYPACISEFEKVFARQKVNKGKWNWTFNQPLENGSDSLIINTTQSYITAMLDAGENTYATQLINMGLQAYPNNVYFLADKAAILYHSNDLKGALNAYLKILKIAPNDYLVAYNIAYLYENMGYLKKACKYYKLATKATQPEIVQSANQALDDIQKALSR